MAKKKAETRGRKKLKPSEKRDIEIRIRLNKKENKILRANAKDAGYDSVAVWLRDIGLESK
jgi:hypothetical protein